MNEAEQAFLEEHENRIISAGLAFTFVIGPILGVIVGAIFASTSLMYVSIALFVLIGVAATASGINAKIKRLKKRPHS